MNTGAVASSVQLTVLETVLVFPQPSIALNVLVCERLQVELVTDPSLDVIVTAPHPSVAVAVPSAAVISDGIGLHARFTAV